MKAILAIDLGTTGNRVVAFSREGAVIARSYYEFPQLFPRPGWVEHDPRAIWTTTLRALKEVLSAVGPENVLAIGITNQRETTVMWDRSTGKPVHNAIVWQCRRTRDLCARPSRATPRGPSAITYARCRTTRNSSACSASPKRCCRRSGKAAARSDSPTAG